MTKEVTIQIKGQQLGSEEEPIITIASGTYHLHNDRHYIQYEEIAADERDIVKNTIKIGTEKIELSKKGKEISQMIFDLKEKTQTFYQTSFGSLMLEITTNEIKIEESPEQIIAHLEYTLSSNEEPISDHHITITVLPLQSHPHR